MPKSERQRELSIWIQRSAGTGLEAWDIDSKISEGQVGDCHEVDNHELEEAQGNKDIEESQLANLRCKLPPMKGKV